MGWGTDFNTSIYLSRMVFNNKEELLDTIQEKEDDLINIQKDILMYVSSNPSDIIPEDWDDEPIMFMRLKINELYDEQRELIENLKDLYYYKEYLEDN